MELSSSNCCNLTLNNQYFYYLFTLSKPFQVVSKPPAIFVPLRGQNALKIKHPRVFIRRENIESNIY